MLNDKLTPLQRRILQVLAEVAPPWTLTGGGALAGIYLGHRATRDLDLFWRARADLGHSPVEVQGLLRAEGPAVAVLRTSPMFVELRASDAQTSALSTLVSSQESKDHTGCRQPSSPKAAWHLEVGTHRYRLRRAAYHHGPFHGNQSLDRPPARGRSGRGAALLMAACRFFIGKAAVFAGSSTDPNMRPTR